MWLRRKGVVVLALSAVVIASFAGFIAHQAAAAPKQGGVLSTITSAQLAAVGVKLDPPSGTPSVDESKAIEVAQGLWGDQPIREAVPADCSRPDFDPSPRLCWAVSLAPPAEPVVSLRGPDPDYNAKHPITYTFYLALVDATDASLIVGIRSNFDADGNPPK